MRRWGRRLEVWLVAAGWCLGAVGLWTMPTDYMVRGAVTLLIVISVTRWITAYLSGRDQ